MATYTLPGIRLTGRIDNGTLAFDSRVDFVIAVADEYRFDYIYSNPETEGTFLNAFDIPEVWDTGDSEFDADGGLTDGGIPDEFYIYRLNYTNGQSVDVMEFYQNNTGYTYLFEMLGSQTSLPVTASQFNQALALLDQNNPASLLPSSGPMSLGDFPGATTTQNDVFYDDRGFDSTYSGGIGDDAIYVLDGDDTAFGGAGNDRVVANGGTANTFFGQGGNDVLKFKALASGEISGGSGDDKIVGADGNDTLTGDGGSDTIIGLGGQDDIDGGVGNDFLYGGRDNDIVHGGDGDDVVRGNRNDDELHGGDGTDRLYGGGNNDILDGGADRDFLVGENGNDRLDGGEGNDNLTGGAGADVFEFATGGGFDRILDFEDGIDTIDVSGTTANSLGDITLSSAGGGTDTRLDFGGGDVLYLNGVNVIDIDSSDFVF